MKSYHIHREKPVPHLQLIVSAEIRQHIPEFTCQECKDTGEMRVPCSEAGWDLAPCSYCEPPEDKANVGID